MPLLFRTSLYSIVLFAAAFTAFGSAGLLITLGVLLCWGRYFKVTQKLLSFGCLVTSVILCIVIVVLIPLVQTARNSIERLDCMFNIKHMSYAFNNYELANGAYPPAYLKSKEEKRFHSWRTLILPYLDEKTTFNNYEMDEAWNGPHNGKLARILIYGCPSSEENEGNTNYFAVVDDKTVFNELQETKPVEIHDGTSKTLLLMEVHGRGVHWAEPNDLTFDEAVEILTTTDPKKAGCGHIRRKTRLLGFQEQLSYFRWISMADGSLKYIPMGIPRKIAIALLTKAGREDFEVDSVYSLSKSNHGEWKTLWVPVYALAVLVLIIFLPIPWAIRHRKRIKSSATDGPPEEMAQS